MSMSRTAPAAQGLPASEPSQLRRR